ncbi:hypothetical protein EV363DRAFT_1153865, partial [Boletus edulis]
VERRTLVVVMLVSSQLTRCFGVGAYAAVARCTDCSAAEQIGHLLFHGENAFISSTEHRVDRVNCNLSIIALASLNAAHPVRSNVLGLNFTRQDSKFIGADVQAAYGPSRNHSLQPRHCMGEGGFGRHCHCVKGANSVRD